MKFKIGDQVMYNAGDLRFFGRISAIFEHSICPCYRLSVEWIEKKNCGFSITQFEFELKEDLETEKEKDKRQWNTSEVEYLKQYYGVLPNDDLAKILKRSPQSIEEKWNLIKQEQESEPEKKTKRKLKTVTEQKNESTHSPELEQDTASEPIEKSTFVKRIASVSTKKPRQKKYGARKSDAWEKNLELYLKGDRSNIIHSWVSYNRKQYMNGVMPEEKIKILKAIHFSFESPRRKISEWDKNLERWKKGERNALQQWRQGSVKKYVEGKLEKDKIQKLMEVGILQ